VGWGKVFDALFDDRVTVTNSAVGGRSVHTWLYNVQKSMDASGECELELDQSGNPVLQARWTAMLDGMKAGDYLFIQFGINDGDSTCDRHVGLDAFKESYGMMAAAAKERGAQPIFVTPVSAISCKGSAAQGTRGAYVTTTIDAGKEFDVPVIDLHAKSVALYTSLGFCPLAGGDVSESTTGPVGDFFCDDHTHLSSAGALEIAGLVAQALRDQNIPLAAYLKARNLPLLVRRHGIEAGDFHIGAHTWGWEPDGVRPRSHVLIYNGLELAEFRSGSVAQPVHASLASPARTSPMLVLLCCYVVKLAVDVEL
jgi:lysophospholipase L1-like esterase